MAESIIKLAWIQFDTFTLEQCWSPDLRFSLNSFVLFLILLPCCPFRNPASWAGLNNAIVVLWTFMKNWHEKWVPDLFLIVLVAGLCITLVVFGCSAPQHTWLQTYQERGVDQDCKSPVEYVVVECMSRSLKMAVLLLFVHALLESPCFIHTLLTRMCLAPCPKDASLQEIWSCHFHV